MSELFFFFKLLVDFMYSYIYRWTISEVPKVDEVMFSDGKRARDSQKIRSVRTSRDKLPAGVGVTD